MTTATERFADWGLSIDLADVPASAKDAALLHVLDGFGIALVAAQRGEGSYAVEVARANGGNEGTSVLGTGLRVNPAMAAFANGVLIHALDYDDTHSRSLVHPTSVVLPVALACGEAKGASGADVLAAILVGNETILHIGAVIPHGFHSRGFHPTSVCGVFAAALVAARLTGLDRDRSVNAMGIAGSFASGLLEFLEAGTATKPMHPGWAAHAGIVAAQLAAAGAPGPSTVLEGKLGLFSSFLGADVDADAITQDLGSKWEIESTSFKPYPACQLSHASLEALATVLDGDARSITFDVPSETAEIVCEPRATKVRPRTTYEAKFSLPWTAAAMYLDREVNVSTYDALDRPDVIALAERIDHRLIEADVPADAPGRVEVTASDGSSRVGEAAGGGREATHEAITAKLRSHGLPHTDELIEAVLSLESAPDLNNVLATVRVLVPTTSR